MPRLLNAVFRPTLYRCLKTLLIAGIARALLLSLLPHPFNLIQSLSRPPLLCRREIALSLKLLEGRFAFHDAFPLDKTFILERLPQRRPGRGGLHQFVKLVLVELPSLHQVWLSSEEESMSPDPHLVRAVLFGPHDPERLQDDLLASVLRSEEHTSELPVTQ